jgi:hypothetical protein
MTPNTSIQRQLRDLGEQDASIQNEEEPYDFVEGKSFIKSNYMRMHAGVPAMGGAPLIVEERQNKKAKKQLLDGQRKRRHDQVII